MLASLFGWDIFFYPIRKENHSYLVIILNGTECQCGSYLGHHFSFGLFLGTKIQRARDINE